MSEPTTTVIPIPIPIPIIFITSTPSTSRPPVLFSTSFLPRGGSVTVFGKSSGGWVFCGIEDDGCGELLHATGATVTGVSGLSNDDCECEFIVAHDGISQEIVITYSTRAD
jgi:hypothetical protein